MIVALAAELVHSGTALKMMPNVFGTKVIMLPAYACCILTKLGLALGLFISMVYVPVGGYKEQCSAAPTSISSYVQVWLQVHFNLALLIDSGRWLACYSLSGCGVGGARTIRE